MTIKAAQFSLTLAIITAAFANSLAPETAAAADGTWMPEILSPAVQQKHYLPDFSYAGYHWGEDPLPTLKATIRVTDFGAVPNDDKDDSEAVTKALAEAHRVSGPAVVQFPKGKLILTSILFIEKSQIVLQGSGSGADGTVLYFPKPLRTLPIPEDFAELREYLDTNDSRQKEPERGINERFSMYAWSGGYIWTRVPGGRAKPYMAKYQQPAPVLANARSGKRGQHTVEVDSAERLKPGQLVRLQWYNREGERSSLIQHLYDNKPVTVGVRHWENPGVPLIKQEVTIERVEGKVAYLKQPLLHDLRPEWTCEMVEWKHLSEIGIEHLRVEFSYDELYAHHLEKGFNGIYMTNTAHSWVHDVVVKNADSAFLSDSCANVTVEEVRVGGRKGHYAIQFGDCYNMLGKRIYAYNETFHTLSFNTGARGCAYTDCVVTRAPSLDQHSGANHQNLFDKIKVMEDDPDHSCIYVGGAGYWAPTHGAFSTFWNLQIWFCYPNPTGKPIKIQGVKNGASARIIGVTANYPTEVKFEFDPYVEGVNRSGIAVPSLYQYQLEKRRPAKK